MDSSDGRLVPGNSEECDVFFVIVSDKFVGIELCTHLKVLLDGPVMGLYLKL